MKVKTIVLYVLAFLAYFLVSCNTPRVGDDNMYLVKYYQNVSIPAGEYGTWNSVKIEGNTFRRSMEMAWWEFKHDTGRFMSFICVHNLIPYPKIVFSIVSSLLWVVFLHLIWRFSCRSEKWKLSIFALSYFCLLQNDANLWMGGASAYLWPVAWSLLLVPIFLSHRLVGSALERKNLWMWFILPVVGFCGGGWHEIIGVPVCFLLLIYWVGVVRHLRRVPINGRLILTVSYGIASLVVVFAPSALARFDRQSGADIGYLVLVKTMSLVNTVVFNPVVLAMVVVVAVLLWRKSTRMQVLRRNIYWLLMFLSLVAIVCFLGEGAERTSWPVSVLALIILLRTLPDLWRPASCRGVTMTCCVLGGLTFVYSFYGVVRTRHNYEHSVAEWLKHPYDLCGISENPDSLLGFLFDRSLSARSLVWFGPAVQNMNPSLAARYNRPLLLGLPEKALRAFGDGQSFCTEDRMFTVNGVKWYADSSLDILVCPLVNKENGLVHGKECLKRIGYSRSQKPDFEKLKHMFICEVSANWGGPAIFKVSNFFQDFSRDVIYSSLYLNRPAPGFVVKTDKGAFLILKHSRFNARKDICSIED